MGMSSSQARLLTLTARLHSIEHKAQKIEAEKLRLANDSDKVYETYLRALDATKIQYSALQADGTMTFVDATLARLENGAVPSYNGETSKNTYLLYNGAENKVLVTPEFAAEYGITGEDQEELGSLEEYLLDHGCTKEPVMRTVTETNYNDVQSVTPVANQLISTPSTIIVPDSDTYSISGTLSTPVDNSVGATTSYSVSGTTPSVSSSAGSANLIDVVTGGSPATVKNVTSTSNTEVESTTFILPSTFKKVTGTTYSLKNQADLDKSFEELYTGLTTSYTGSDHPAGTYQMDFNDTTSSTSIHTISLGYGNGFQGNSLSPYPNDYSHKYDYDKNTTLRQVLEDFASQNNSITFDANNGTISYNNGWLYLGSHDILPWNQGDGATISASFNWERQYGAEQNITLNTKMVDLAYSNVSTGDTDSWMREAYIKIDGKNYKYNGSKSNTDVTLKDYLDNIIEQANNDGITLAYTTGSDGISLTAEGDHSISYDNFRGGNISKVENTTSTDTISIKEDAIAENIYLARSIINETPSEQYNAEHNTKITSILNELKSAYGNYSTDENKRQLLLFSEQLSTALASGDKTQIQNALAKLGQTITSDSYKSDDSKDYIFNIDNTDVSLTPNVTSVPDGTSGMGDLTVNGSNAELEKYLAYKLYQNNSAQSYEQYLASIQGQGYNVYQLAELVENFGSFKSQLAAGTNLSSSLIKYSASTYTLNQTATGYNVTNNSTPATQEVTVANTDDILDRLAYDIYTKQASGNPNTIKTQLRNSFSDEQLASLSSFYGQPAWNTIVNNLSANLNASAVSAYTNKYTGYNITYRTSNNVTINTVSNSHPETIKGKVNVPSIKGIASNMVIAFRKAGYTVDEADVLAKLEAKYNADNNTNNLTLANINEVICNYLNNNAGNVSNIYNHIMNNSTLNITKTYNNDYNATRVDMGIAKVTYGTVSHEEPTGEMKWVEDDNYRTWYSKYMQLLALQGLKFEIVAPELCIQNQFINNWITEGGAHLLAFGNDESGEFNLKDTNVSVETALLEVSNELGLKKAEAQYEADMKKIDRKDRQYDTELAKFENERNAIKEEIDTLKTVAKENVDRTFKLFS